MDVNEEDQDETVTFENNDTHTKKMSGVWNFF